MTDLSSMMKNSEFVIENYNNAKAFSSFLPAIAGLWGKPLWLYYVNRGQAAANFGIRDKDGAMMEFVAANKAYRLTASQGFRTFYKVDGVFYEPFHNVPDLAAKGITQTMYIKPHMVSLRDICETAGLETWVEFFTLPNESFPALLRRLTVKNISPKTIAVECLDGLPMLLPWGTRDWMLKNMSRLAEGWFAGVHFTPEGTPYYKLPVEALDRPEIIPLNGAHFYCGLFYVPEEQGGHRHIYCVDPDTIFGEQRDFAFPQVFLRSGVPFSPAHGFSGKNKTPSAMGSFAFTLPPGVEASYVSMIGHCGSVERIDDAAALLLRNKKFFEEKQKENESLIAGITRRVWTKSAFPCFDTYCAQNFIDNALRGGIPINIGGKGMSYYAYSRVHGDMEREYNSFLVLSEYFSQGNGNYRDVNQNRRSDIFFNQDIQDDTIHFFMSLLQTDGFNPLKVLGVRFVFETDAARGRFLDDFSRNTRLSGEQSPENSSFLDALTVFIAQPITIGALFNFIEERGIALVDRNALLDSLLENTAQRSLAAYGEGYWSDHWHYNTSLIENYLAVFPDRLEAFLLDRVDYTFYDDCRFVEPRSVKYVLFKGKPAQCRALSLDREKQTLIASRAALPNAVRGKYGHGDIYFTSLLGKLLSLIANKYASLDPEGLGIEMEADKPNWCDALNGLPGLFGSSSAESLELLRLVSLVKTLLAEIAPGRAAPIAEETLALLDGLAEVTREETRNFEFWDKTHTLKEAYREKTRLGFSGKDEERPLALIKETLALFETKLEKTRAALDAASDEYGGVIPTYFAFVPAAWEPCAAVPRHGEAASREDGGDTIAAAKVLAAEKTIPVRVSAFTRKTLPIFLEGPVHFLRLRPENAEATAFHALMLKSPLYDEKLGMFKINAPLVGAEAEGIGRITVFTPGWLENESIWLHMEYKYLLELLRNDQYEAFFSLARTALVPFFDPKVYGRSVFENSSFLVSSAHPETAIHGQGFVARLSGATAEFISMWIAMTSGLRPFSLRGGGAGEAPGLCLELRPVLAKEFFTKEGDFSFMFLGKTPVVYHNPLRKNTFGEAGARTLSYRITLFDGKAVEISGRVVTGKMALAVRNGQASRIDVALG